MLSTSRQTAPLIRIRTRSSRQASTSASATAAPISPGVLDRDEGNGSEEEKRRHKRTKHAKVEIRPIEQQIVKRGDTRRKEAVAISSHTHPMDPPSEDCFVELLRVAEAHLTSSTVPPSIPASSSRRGDMHADQHLIPIGSQPGPLDWSSFLTGSMQQQQIQQQQQSQYNQRQGTSQKGDKSTCPIAVTTCDECHTLPAPCSAAATPIDQCCAAPCPIACPLSPSASTSALACAMPTCCDEIPAVVACQDAECATTIPCEDVRCLDPSSKVAHTINLAAESCSDLCEAALAPRRKEKKPKKITPAHPDTDPCPTCDGSQSQRYSSFQELLDCWCCSDHELEQCCTSKPDECASVVEACETCCLEESAPSSSSMQIAPKVTPTITPSPRSRSTSHSVSLSSFSSPGESYDHFASNGTMSDYWSSGSRGAMAGGSDSLGRVQKESVRLLDCIFEEEHMHTEAGACVPPALTMYKRDGYGGDDATSTSHQATFTCHWAGCGMQCSSIDDLANHVNGTHLNLPGKATSSTVPSASSSYAWDADQGQSLRCMWDACQMQEPSAVGEPSMLPSWQESNLILQHILQAHVGIEDAPSPASSSGMKRKRGEAAQKGQGHDHGLLHMRQDSTSSCQSNKDDVHQCAWQECSLSFDSHQALTEHITAEHVGSGKAEYECLWRGCARGQRKFHQKQKMLRHLQTHTHHRPFVCEICKKCFSEANTLSQHRRTHTNERPYVCDHPGCGKSFAVAGSLTIHKRIHSGEKPFKCSWPGCDRAFSESSNLAKHHRIHSGAKPFECPEAGCSMSFARSDQLARHKKIHEKGSKRRDSGQIDSF